MSPWRAVSTDVVHVWLIGAQVPEPVLARLHAVLDDGERQRAEALLHAQDRRRFVIAHGAVRVIVGARLGVPAERIRWQLGRNGKPELAAEWTGVRVSLSHSGDLSMVAITDERDVGVDVQQLLPSLDATGMAARFFPPAEARFVAAGTGPAEAADRFGRLWTRKEACIKASGGRLMQGMTLPVYGTGRIVVVDHPDGALPGPYVVTDVPVPQGFAASVALEGAQPYRMVPRWWSWDE